MRRKESKTGTPVEAPEVTLAGRIIKRALIGTDSRREPQRSEMKLRPI
jgi:hypothetical protein